MQLDPLQRRDQRGAHRARAAAEVDDDSSRPGEAGGLTDEELGADAGDEHAVVDDDPQAAELGPAENVFERQAGHSPVDHGGEVGRRARRGDEQPRLVLGEHTAGGPKPGDDDGFRDG